MTEELQLLDEYKKYDYLNACNNPLVKILVGYIKPSFLFKSEILTPIHLGRAVEKESSKDGIQSSEDLKWLHENCEFNDDFEGGISKYNRRVGFLTGTYWAWKNYEKLGSPEYFGFFGYRRLFFADIIDEIKNLDLVAPKPRKNPKTYYERLTDFLGNNFLNNSLNLIYQECSSERKMIDEYLNQDTIYFDEIYIMKKELFFEFCEWIFPILFQLLTLEKSEELTSVITTRDFLNCRNESRDIAYLAEALTGYFIYKTLKSNHTKVKTVDTIVLYRDKPQNLLDVLRNKIKNKNKAGQKMA